jgi:hypothetical protein
MHREKWKVRPADLRRIAAKTSEPGRERKMLVLADKIEEMEAQAHHEDQALTKDVD